MPASRTALLLAGVLGAAALCACTDQPSPTVAGEVVTAPASLEIIGDFGFVLVPTGRVDVVVGKPRAGEVKPDEASDGHDHEAPDGGSWIPVRVAHDPFGHLAVPVGLMGGSPRPAQVALVVDGTTVNLGAPYRVVGDQGTADSGLDNVWVAVDQRPDEVESVQVAVTYDGLTQTLDPKTGDRDGGAAEPLYVAEGEELEATCAPDDPVDRAVRLDLACVVGPAQRTPYLPGAGWAEVGRSWMVVGVAVSVGSAVVERTAYAVESIEPSMTVGTQDPLPPDERFGQVRHDPDRASVTWAYDAPAEGPLPVTLSLGLVLTKSDPEAPGPGTRRVEVEQTVELG